MFEELIRFVFLELLVSLKRAVCGTAYVREVAIATFVYTGDAASCGLPPSCSAGPSMPVTSESAGVGLHTRGWYSWNQIDLHLVE